jgi:hypothetical protein
MRFGARSSVWVLAFCAIAAGCSGGGVTREYEYEEELYLALDGSAMLNLNASVASLVALHGVDLDPDPRARVDREWVRALFEGEGARASVSLARRDSRRFVHVTVTVNDVRTLSRLAPFAWSSYRVDRRGDHVEFRQVVGPPARTSTGIQWTGDEIVMFKMHLPSEIVSHNSPSGRIERGNILEWEQPLQERLAGRTLNIAVDLSPQSILYTTLILFGSSLAAAAAALALIIWWMARRGRESEVTEAA